jgi:hypothetical protein
MTTRTVTSVSTTITIDLIDVITVTIGPIIAMTIGIDMITAATIAAMTDVTTMIATTTTTNVMTTRVITVTTSAVTAEMIDVMIDIARTTTTTTTTTARSDIHHHHHPKGATPMVHFSQPTERSTSSLVVAKRPKATGSSDQTQGRSSTSTLKLHKLCVGRSSQILSPRKIIGSIFLAPRPTRWSLLTMYFGTPSLFITLWFGFDYGTNPPLGTLII